MNISPDNLSLGSSFTVSWNVSYSSVNGLYSAEAYLSPDQNVPSIGNYQLFGRNCGGSPIYSCGSSGSVTCNYVNKINGVPVFDCGMSTQSVPFSGKGYLVFKACIFNENFDYVCDKRAIPITVN